LLSPLWILLLRPLPFVVQDGLGYLFSKPTLKPESA
jgi:hypothetical protein